MEVLSHALAVPKMSVNVLKTLAQTAVLIVDETAVSVTDDRQRSFTVFTTIVF